MPTGSAGGGGSTSRGGAFSLRFVAASRSASSCSMRAERRERSSACAAFVSCDAAATFYVSVTKTLLEIAYLGVAGGPLLKYLLCARGVLDGKLQRNKLGV